METKDIITEVFRKNRLGVRVVEENVRFSYIVFILERIVSTEKLTDSRIKRIRDDLKLRLGYTPDIREEWLIGGIVVYVKNPSPYFVKYSNSVLRYFEFGFYLPFASGVDGNFFPLLSDFNDSPLVLINGEDGYGKTNLIKVIIKSSRPRGNVKYIIGDLSGGGYRKSSSVTVLRDKNGVLASLDELDNEIKRRKEKKKEKTGADEDIVFIIDGYSSLCTTLEESEAFIASVKSIKKSGRKYGVFLVLASPEIPRFFDEEFVSLFNLIFTFKMKNEKESYLLHSLDNLPLPLYESGDAFCLNNNNKTITRMQCYKL